MNFSYYSPLFLQVFRIITKNFVAISSNSLSRFTSSILSIPYSVALSFVEMSLTLVDFGILTCYVSIFSTSGVFLTAMG